LSKPKARVFGFLFLLAAIIIIKLGKQKTHNSRYGIPFAEKEGLFSMIPDVESSTIIKPSKFSRVCKGFSFLVAYG
jgi:hypothetical protein